jgi:hypothetical protein
MQSRKCRVILSIGVAVLGVWLLAAQLGARRASAREAVNPWPLTDDGRSRLAGWSPEGRAVLVNRWGKVLGDGATRQALGELWAVDVGDGQATRLSENAVQPAYAKDGRQLAYLAYAGDGQWEVRVQDVDGGQERAHASADWRTPPAWVEERLTFARAGRLWTLGRQAAAMAGSPILPVGARVRLSGVGGRAAWSDGARLWVLPCPGGEPRLLAADAPVLDFCWSPDGGRLAYLTAADRSPALWVADVTGDKAHVLLAQGRAEVFGTPAWSPDGRTLAFSRAPLGAETASASDVWLVDADGGNLRPLFPANDLEESHPAWSPDGHYLAFERADNVWLLDLTQPPNPPTYQSPNLPISHSPTAQQTPPDTIRVIHREANYYRDVPPGQIDVIPFEEYVKRCVPVEVYASWPAEALKVQAMAARTYAWYYVELHAGEEWDVSDWTDYQVMGRDDQRDPRSDAAVDATRGQYVAYQGAVIKAFYSARNGSPTRSLDTYPYIRAVNDPVSFGDERYGHGWGMSQWGAYRWAAWHGWSYQQILAHYYADVTVELPRTGGPLPLGGVTLPWNDHFVTGNRVYVVANASDEASDVSVVTFCLPFDGITILSPDRIESDGWNIVWNLTAFSDTSTSQALTLPIIVSDGAGNTWEDAVHVGIDRRPPTETTALIESAYIEDAYDNVTVTISSLSASDPSPGSGVRSMAFGNEGWAWEGEDLYHTSGEAVEDPDALNGWAWRGLTATHAAGTWYGPYTSILPPDRAYRAYFRLKTNDTRITERIATLDVVDDGGTTLLGLRHLRGTDFRADGVYQEFGVDFDYAFAGTSGLEFRTVFHAAADLYLDRVLVVAYPVDVAASARWRLSPGEGRKTVTIKFIDGAGNVSADLTRTVTLDASPPTGWVDFAPAQWDGGPPPTCTVRVRDEASGLDVDSARYRFSTDGGVSWSDWLTASCTGISGTTGVQTITAPAVPFGLPRTPSNQVQFRVADVAGITATATYVVRGPVSIAGPTIGALDTPYTFTASVNPLTGTVALPITYTWWTSGQPSVVHRGGGSDAAVFGWTAGSATAVVPHKLLVVTATDAGGDVGSAVHGIFIGRRVYLPLVMRN